MSAIDDLKSGDIIDITSPKAAAKASNVRVNTTGGTKAALNSNTSNQEKVNISDIVGPAPKESDREDLHSSLEEDLLDLTNPNSAFSRYINDKKAEYDERMAEYDEEVAAAKEEAELNGEELDTETDNNVVGRKVMTEELELDDLMEEEDTPEEVTVEESVEDLDDLINEDADEDDPEQEVLHAEVPVAPAAVEDDIPVVTEEEAAKEEEKKESIKATDLELDLSSVKSEVVEDVEEDDDEEEDDEENDEILNKLKKMATERLKPKSKIIDISNFKVAKANVTNINPILNIKESKVAKWVLPAQEQVVLMREFSGAELQTFVETATQTSVSNMTRRYRLIYNHIESPKPDSFEAWLKSTPFSDLDHYFFAVYVASFQGANYIPADCPNDKCEDKTFVSEDVPIMDMVKFTSDETKKKFTKIYKEEEVNINNEGKYATVQVPVSNTLAISFKEPTLYNFIEARNVDDAFRRKYSTLVDIIAYIDEIFIIDAANATLIPVGFKEYPGNSVKTFKSKVRKYDALFNTLTADEYSSITAYISDISKNSNMMSYVTPKLTCPCCGSTTEETDVSAEGLVFTRYQLGALVNTTLN